ncbi:hypothetical protein DB346_12535 [Verrucomicrobia bacterium LW23]|nr:hypothetical protein DB346_12535 [Verrucomicrobia bacterium LW23]
MFTIYFRQLRGSCLSRAVWCLIGAVAIVVQFGSRMAANPSGGSVVAGSADITSSGGRVTVKQGSDRAIVNWKDFSVGRSEEVSFVQPSSRSAVLNRVTGSSMSRLDGTLNANGSVYLINRNGIVIGKTGRINAAGFTASTSDVDNAQFMRGGSLNFRGRSDASVVNYGKIRAIDGDVSLIARRVENHGKISAKRGQVNLAGATEVLLKPQGSGGQMVYIQGKSDSGSVYNSGSIRATAVELRAAGGNEYALAVNNSGIIRATAIDRSGGRIVLRAERGSVRNSGSLIARADRPGRNGGDIVVTGEHVLLTSTSKIDASGMRGQGGRIRIGGGFQGKDSSVSNSRTITVEAGAELRAEGGTRGGTVIVWSDGNTRFAGNIRAGASAPNGGGFVEVSGKSLLEFWGNVDTGGGTLLLDPASITISTDPTSGTLDTGTDPIVSTIDSVLNVGDLVNLMLVNNVTLQATDFITVATAITSTSNNNLTLDTTTLNLLAPIQLGSGTLSGTATVANVSGTGLIQNAVHATSTVTAPTVNVAAGTYHEHDIVINKALTLSGAGSANTVVNADQAGRVFRVTSSGAGTVMIDGMTITGGLATVTSVGVANPRAAAGGGILLHNGARLVVSNSVLTDNEARGTPTATAHAFASGGAIYVVAGGNLTIENSQITGNRATSSSTVTIAGNTNSFAFGGGIYIANGIASSRLTISGNTDISGNSATADSSASANTANSVAQGGGIYLAGAGIFNLGGSSITGNSAVARSSASPSTVATAEGGGVYATGAGTLTLPGTLVSNNLASATSNGTGVSSNVKANVHGGGLFFSNGNYTISNGTQVNGNTATARATPGDASDAYAESFGGGLYAFNAARLQITDSEINTNTAGATSTSVFGQTTTTYAEGGGLYIQSAAAGTYSITGSRIYGNSATAGSSNSASTPVDVSSLANAYGGGLYFFNGGTLTVSNTEIADNRSHATASVATGDATTDSTARAEAFGGGVYLQNGTFVISSSSLYRNGGAAVSSNGSSNPLNVSENLMIGGGLAVGTLDATQSVTLENVTLNQNAGQYGGGVAWFGDLGSVSLNSVTVAGNSASIHGGGIYRGNPSGAATTGDFTVANSIVATNASATFTDGPDASGRFTDGGFNLIGITDGATGFGSGATPSDSALLGTSAAPVDPKLTPLGMNGGTTRTMALQAGSPALDAGFTSLLSDQRGIARPQGSQADIGAIESTGILYTLTYLATSGSNQQATLGQAFALPLVVTLTADFGFDVTGTPISLLVPLSGPTASGILTQTVDSTGIATFFLTAEGAAGTFNVGISGVSPSPLTTFSLENLAIPLFITPDFITKTVGQADPALTFTVTPGLYGSDTLTGILAGSLSRTAGEGAGLYDILQNTLALRSSALSRYTLAFASGANHFRIMSSPVTPPPVTPPPDGTPAGPGVPAPAASESPANSPDGPPGAVDSTPGPATARTRPDSPRITEFNATRGRNDTEDPRLRKKAVHTPKVTYVVRPYVVSEDTVHHDSSFKAFADQEIRTSSGRGKPRSKR